MRRKGLPPDEQQPGIARDQLHRQFCADEETLVAALLAKLRPAPEPAESIEIRARSLIDASRNSIDFVQRLQQLYALAEPEGTLLLALAEALPRIPDTDTALYLLRDTLQRGRWRNIRTPAGIAARAVALSLVLAGKLATSAADANFGKLQLRTARSALRVLARRFIFAESLGIALGRAHATSRRERFSFDMLGEASLTQADADRYFAAYMQAIAAVGQQASGTQLNAATPTISIKLSALSPRYQISKRGLVLKELTPKLRTLAGAARNAQVQLTIDAEEAERLELSLDLFEAVRSDPELAAWPGFGLAVQAYQKRALPLLDWLTALARKINTPIPVRLVKGAYWDAEIKRAQQGGYQGFPVYTRKAGTDLAYLVCAQALLHAERHLVPQFATHNAYTVAYLLAYRELVPQLEFQRLHGMGAMLYRKVFQDHKIPCRVYAPIGLYKDLLPYLLRRLLENGANSSFVNQIPNSAIDIAALLRDPAVHLQSCRTYRNPKVTLPADLYAPERRNSSGFSFAEEAIWKPLARQIAERIHGPLHWEAGPIINGQVPQGSLRSITDPANSACKIGTVVDADGQLAEQAMASTHAAFARWSRTPVAGRSEILERLAARLEAQPAEFVALLIREAGKCIPDAFAELREAVDLLRYYASEARRLQGEATLLPGASGEVNSLSLHGRGVFVCISPWNFPLAIFIGQIAAALASGNTVIAKPAEQTPLIAALAVRLFLQAGLPAEVIALLPGDGPILGARLLRDKRLAGVCFTGSTDTAKLIQQALASKPGPIVPLIAETGGINALIADSSAHPEQLVQDLVWSAFNSAGQRCSALRLLILQEDGADRIEQLLAGMIDTLALGDPGDLATDVGPLIDASAVRMLQDHRQRLERDGRCIAAVKIPATLPAGHYFGPCAYVIPHIDWLQDETFGPILHVVRYRATELDQVIAALNAKAYGLTLGIHSRIGAFIDHVRRNVAAGNTYVNRNMIGAVVGTQPFGGEGLSGTGPKAGGPNYLLRFTTERTLSINTAAIGGDPRLLNEAD